MSEKIIPGLNQLLSDYMVFYQKLRNYHWNVQGPLFFGLHQVFEEQYLASAEKVDEIAERVRSLGGKPASTLREYLEHARLTEDDGNPSANQMVERIVTDLSALTGNIRELVKEVDGDVATVNLLEGFADEQEKTAWMLKAFLQS